MFDRNGADGLLLYNWDERTDNFGSGWLYPVMGSITINGETIYTLPPPHPSAASALIFALPKSGSVMLDGIVRELCAVVGLPYVSVPGELFAAGYFHGDGKTPPNVSEVFFEHGYCYGGFRAKPREYEIPIVGKVGAVLLVRDPRDMLVSLYYSTSNHPPLGRGVANPAVQLAHRTTLTEFVEQWAESPFFQDRLDDYVAMVRAGAIRKLFRYEDVVFKKRQWVKDIRNTFGWAIDDKACEAIALKFDMFPEQEQQEHHIRQVTPGDHERKLGQATIARLNKTLAGPIEFFGYA